MTNHYEPLVMVRYEPLWYLREILTKQITDLRKKGPPFSGLKYVVKIK